MLHRGPDTRPWLACCAAFCLLLVAGRADAYLELTTPPRAPHCPPIPGVENVELSPAEWEEVERGEIVMRIVEPAAGERMAQAIGYLAADPVWLFDLSTDSSLAREFVSEIEEVVVLERDRFGKLFTNVLDPGMFVLPTFQYTLASAYPVPPTGQCWAQVEGDFERNEGSHSYFWDPERGESLTVFTFVFRLKGLLSLVPERTVLKRSAAALENYMERVEAMAVRFKAEDPARTARNAEAWAALRPRLEAGEFPGRLWTGYPPPRRLNPPDPAMAELHGLHGNGSAAHHDDDETAVRGGNGSMAQTDDDVSTR